MSMHPQPHDQAERMDALSAIKSWLLGEYQEHDEERMLLLAIRRDTGLELSDTDIRHVLMQALAEHASALGAFERVVMLEAAVDAKCGVSGP